MTIETAIKKAIEGGWRSDDPMVVDGSERYVNMVGYEKILLDPTFWQCLGKAMGFDTTEKIRMCVGCGVALRWNEQTTMDGKHGGKNGCGSDIEEYDGQWLIEWHRFIDHLADGGDVNSFFEKL